MSKLETATAVAGMDPATALKYSWFVDTAYRMFDDNPGVINPPQPSYFPTGWKILTDIVMTDFFGSETKQEFYGFYAINQAKPSEIVIAFRGTRGWMEWWDDFHFELVPCKTLSGFSNPGDVAEGFQDIYETFTIASPGGSAELSPLTDAVRPTPDIDLSAAGINATAVGHSLGSALATIYAGDVASNGANLSVYTLASPRVGNPDFVTAYNSLIRSSTNPNGPINDNYRIWNWPDIVPRFPKDPFDGGYAHVAGGYEVDSLEYLTIIKETISCFHAHTTYMYCLGDHNKSILGSCAW